MRSNKERPSGGDPRPAKGESGYPLGLLPLAVAKNPIMGSQAPLDGSRHRQMVSIGEPRSYGTKDVSALFEHELVKTSHKRKNSYPTPLGIAKPQKTAPRASQGSSQKTENKAR